MQSTPTRAPEAHRLNREIWALRNRARRRFGLDLWQQRDGIATPELEGHAFGLVDLATRQAVLVTDELDAVRRRLGVG